MTTLPRKHADIVGEAHDRDEIGITSMGDVAAERAVDHHFRLERHGRIVQRVEQAQGAAYALTADFLRVPLIFPKAFGENSETYDHWPFLFISMKSLSLMAASVPCFLCGMAGHATAACRRFWGNHKKTLPYPAIRPG